LGLDRLTGWWTSVVAGDFDGDGLADLACGNWGRNSIYELCQPTTLRMVYGDWDGDNVMELIEAWLGRKVLVAIEPGWRGACPTWSRASLRTASPLPRSRKSSPAVPRPPALDATHLLRPSS
jgi:hypothetical protein